MDVFLSFLHLEQKRTILDGPLIIFELEIKNKTLSQLSSSTALNNFCASNLELLNLSAKVVECRNLCLYRKDVRCTIARISNKIYKLKRKQSILNL